MHIAMTTGARKTLALVAFLLCAFAGTASAQAQDELFTYRERIDTGAPSAASNPATLAEYRGSFDVGALAASESTPARLVLPDGRIYEAVADEITDRGEGSLLWRGRLVGEDDAGQGLITVYRGHVAGRFTIAGDLYELRPDAAGPGTARLLELDDELFPECGGAVDPAIEGSDTAVSEDPPAASTDHGALIDLLVVYTPAARQGAGGHAQIRTIINNAVDWTNLAYMRSRIAQRVSLRAARQVNFNESGIPAGEQLFWLRTHGGVADWRDLYGADMVSMISEDGGGACGIGYLMDDVRPEFAPFAYSVIARDCAVGNLSFPHELGHNMGAEHDPANGNPPGDASYPYSFGHLVDGVFRTIMSYSNQCPNGCTREAYLSNPNVQFSGHPTGIANQRHNARTLNSTAAVVSAFRVHRRSFADVPRNHWAWPWIEGIYGVGVTGGCGTNPLVYCPGRQVTRAGMAVFLLKAAAGRWYQPGPVNGIFSDVPTDSPFAPWIEDLADYGIVAGCDTSPPRFCPTQPVARQQMAVFILKTLLGSDYEPPAATGRFADVPVNSLFAPWIEDLANRGIASGCATSPARFCPKASVNRASMAVFLSRAFHLPTP